MLVGHLGVIGRVEVAEGAEDGERMAVAESVVAVRESESWVRSTRGWLWGSGEPVGMVVLSESEDTVSR